MKVEPLREIIEELEKINLDEVFVNFTAQVNEYIELVYDLP